MMQFLAVLAACLIITSMQGCKNRSHTNGANVAASVVKRTDNEPYKANDIAIVFKNTAHYDIGAVAGTSTKTIEAAQLTLLDINGTVIAQAPVHVGMVQFLAIGGGYSYDSQTAIDLFHGRKLNDILGSYYGGGVGLNLLIGGAGGDIGINRHGVVLRNLSAKNAGLYAQVGPQIVSVEAVNPSDPFWQVAVEATRAPYFSGDSVNRRAWLLDHSVPKDTYRAYLSVNWDPDARNFFAEALVIDNKINTVAKKTRLEYDKANDQFVYASGLLEMHLGLLGDEFNESCFLRWNGQPDTSVVGNCTGWNSFVRSVLGPNGKLSDGKI